MIIMLVAAASFQPPLRPTSVELCHAALARKVDGQVDKMTVVARTRSKWGTVLAGRLTVFVGMASTPSGSASTHHLIRSEYGFECSVRHGRVRRAKLTQP
jgi:hypothetical protein